MKFTKISLLFLLVGLLISFESFPQCKCEKIQREDGTNIFYCSVLPVASDHSTQVGLCASSNKEENFVCVTVGFSNTGQNLIDNLTLRLDNGNLIKLPIVKSTVSNMGNSQVSNGIFSLSPEQSKKLENGLILTLSLILEDGKLWTYQLNTNRDVLMKELKILKGILSNSDLKTHVEANPTIQTNSKLEETIQTNSKLEELDNKNGFRSLQFGKKVSDIYDFKLVPKGRDGGMDIYTISEPGITISDVPVKQIDCYFAMESLVQIILRLDLSGRSDISISNVEDLLVATFGNPKKDHSTIKSGNIIVSTTDESIWIGNRVKLTLSTSHSDNSPIVYSLNYEIKDLEARKREAKNQLNNSHKGDL
jgi:hypothetical protein